MKKGLLLLVLSVTLVFNVVFAKTNNVVATQSPIGTWTTISDKTHRPRSIVKITAHKNTLQAEIVKIYKEPGDKSYCVKCPKPFTNKKIVGLNFLWGMKQGKNNVWTGGRVLDPKSGSIYRCKMTLSPDGKTLKVRGFIGISLFGRTQTWVRGDVKKQA